MFVIESCQKIEYNALFMMIFIPVSNFGDQSLVSTSTKSLMDQMVHTFGIVNVIIIFTIIPSNITSSAVLPVKTDKNYIIKYQNLIFFLSILSDYILSSKVEVRQASS